MRIQHNIAALSANRNLGHNNSVVAKSLEKLSSGYAINRAGDNAAGLAISEKMRAQISCLDQAEINCNDGVSLIQTAEGALSEVHSMLNRMVELCEQSANGTYDDETDRNALNQEMQQLKEEINRISKATNFNGINLLDGTLGGYKIGTDRAIGVNMINVTGGRLTTADFLNVTMVNDGLFGRTGELIINSLGVTAEDETGAMVQKSLGFLTANPTISLVSVPNAPFGAVLNASLYTGTFSGELKLDGQGNWRNACGDIIEIDAGVLNNDFDEGDIINVTARTEHYGVYGLSVSQTQTIENPDGTYTSTLTFKFDKNKLSADFDTDQKKAVATNYGEALDGVRVTLNFQKSQANYVAGTTNARVQSILIGNDSNLDGVEELGAGLSLQIGDTSDDYNKLNIGVDSMSARGLGIPDAAVSTQEGATQALALVRKAINTVSAQRGNLGAMQNRLEHTVNNLSVANENMTIAESRIRDTDMAKEMSVYTSKSILAQAAQSMLAQANQQPQQILSLLQA